MELSHRITHLTEDPAGGWGLFFRARAMKAQGLPVVELTVGEPDIGTDPAILAAMAASAAGGHTGYATLPGTDALRAQVAARVQAQSGVATAPGNVLITPGGQSALFAAHVAVLNPGDTGLFIDPYYATYPGTIRAAGGVARPVAARPEDGFQPRAEDLAAAAGGATSLLVNSPNNPTGAVYARATLEGIAGLARARDLWVISDEVYDSQVWSGAHLSPRALPGMAERTLVIGSMSKSHAMTGSRIGWLIAPEAVITHVANLATHTTYGVAGFIQDAALFALRQGPDVEARLAAPYRRRRDLALALIAAQTVVRAVPAEGAMYLMLDIRATGLSGAEFAERLLEAHLIAVMPGESFGVAARGHVRVALTLQDPALARALSTLLGFAGTLA